MEVCDSHTESYGYRVRDLATFLRERGWQLYRVSRVQPLRLSVVEAEPSVAEWENWLGVRDMNWLQARIRAEVLDGD
ncbi:MAG: hypothetical protein CFK49_12605 [Armatimonadetes bacterium JP3_11]|nr:MAG: hypothetical protein CFK49_12605 [Armatimonadetes bacterium JP3_11]